MAEAATLPPPAAPAPPAPPVDPKAQVAPAAPPVDHVIDPNKSAAETQPTAEVKEGEKAPETPGASEDLTFTIDLGDEKKELNAEGLVEYTQEKIDTALSLADKYEKGLAALADRPLDAALEALTHGKFNGDRGAAYQHLIEKMRAAVKADDEWNKLPEDKRRATESELELNALKAENKKRQEKEESDGRERQKAAAAEQLLREMGEAITKNALPATREVQKAMALFMVQRRAETGQRPTVQEAAAHLKENPYLYLSKEEYRKVLRAEMEAQPKSSDATLEEIKKGREAVRANEPARFNGNPVLPKRRPVSEILKGY